MVDYFKAQMKSDYMDINLLTTWEYHGKGK
jgi:hypothetical protein